MHSFSAPYKPYLVLGTLDRDRGMVLLFQRKGKQALNWRTNYHIIVISTMKKIY